MVLLKDWVFIEGIGLAWDVAFAETDAFITERNVKNVDRSCDRLLLFIVRLCISVVYVSIYHPGYDKNINFATLIFLSHQGRFACRASS